MSIPTGASIAERLIAAGCQEIGRDTTGANPSRCEFFAAAMTGWGRLTAHFHDTRARACQRSLPSTKGFVRIELR
jgi:hypothetical protein